MVKPVNLIDRRLDKTVSRAAFSALEATLAAEGCACLLYTSRCV